MISINTQWGATKVKNWHRVSTYKLNCCNWPRIHPAVPGWSFLEIITQFSSRCNVVTIVALTRPSASLTHPLSSNEKSKEVRPTASAAEFSALPTGEGHSSSNLSRKSNPDNVRSHQWHLKPTRIKAAAAAHPKRGKDNSCCGTERERVEGLAMIVYKMLDDVNAFGSERSSSDRRTRVSFP
jgi:hypothetical protein